MEIKFRAWDKKTKTMRDVIRIDFTRKQVELEPSPLIRNIVDVVLMQDTGLKDKNGERILEGDIVRLLCQENRGEWKDFEVVGKVVFAPEFLQFLVADKTGYIEITNNENYEILEVEVLGNVFENPELLESEVIK